MIFFIKAEGARRGLLSFPTRRSSDLHAEVAEGAESAEQLDQENRFSAGSDPLRARREDRKSTRLNSSHTVISYAVFCLKKKNKKHTKQAKQSTNTSISNHMPKH